MKKVLAFVGIAVLMTSVAAADINPAASKVLNQGGASGTRTNGTLGSVTIAAQQVGALQVQLDATATTQGGNGVPLVTIFNSNTYTLNDQVWLYGQIYDSPWNGGCTFWTTSPGTDWCAVDSDYFVNSPTPLGSFAVSFTATVPAVGNYQTFVLAYAGWTWPGTSFNWFDRTQTVYHSVVETIYIDSTQPPPTPTPPPPGGAAIPVPSLNVYGIVAMALMLIGVAILVMWRRN
jgi:opacity protein-like surface antigen